MVLIRYSLFVVYANGSVGYKFCSFVPYIPIIIIHTYFISHPWKNEY